jgi:anaerobic ribonucleoside-triphosphate reductase activating protein
MEHATLRIADIIKDSTVDGPGVRLAIFVQGCKHNCDGCHNSQTHDFNAGIEYSISGITEIIKRNPHVSGVTFSGGEPLEQANSLRVLAEWIKKNTKMNIIMFTGYRMNDIMRETDIVPLEVLESRRLISLCDFVVDGKFDKTLADQKLRFRGSSNQTVYRILPKQYKYPGALYNDELPMCTDNDWQCFKSIREENQ